MKAHRLFSLLLSLVLSVVLASNTQADHLRSRFAAIAYSESTGRYGYAHGYYSQYAAECEAIRRCNADDAEVVVWARNNWCALALGDETGTYGYAWNGCDSTAKADALRRCRERTTGCHIAVCVFSGH